MKSTRNSKKTYEALVLIVVLAFICSSANGETFYAQSVLHEIGGWANIEGLVGPPDGQYAYTANSLEQPWAGASSSAGSAVWLDFGRIVHSGTIIIYHHDPGRHYTDLVLGPWFGFCPSIPWPVPLASDVATHQGNIQGSGAVTCYTTPLDFRYVRLDHFTLDSSIQDGIDAVAVIEGIPSGVGIDLDPPPAIVGPAVYAADQSNNGYWNNPGAVLGEPDAVYAWSSNTGTMPYLVVDLGRVVYAGTIVIHHDKTHLLKTSLGVSINSEEYDPDPETCPAWPGTDGWEPLWTGHAEGVTTLQFPPTSFRYIQFGQSHCAGGQQDGIDAIEVYETMQELPDFTISDVKPVQVVWNSDIDGDDVNDLVAGKYTAVIVCVGMENHEELDKEELVGIRLSFQGFDETKSKTIIELEENKRIEFYPGSPKLIGDQIITAVVDPENKIEEVDENNNENSIQVTFKDTSGLYLVSFPVNRPLTIVGYGPIDMAKYVETAYRSEEFIGASYPLSNEEPVNKIKEIQFYGHPNMGEGMLWDAIGLWAWGELATSTLADRVIGIVPDDYFEYHLHDKTGKFFPHLPTVFVRNGYWTTAAHEIGHTYGLRWPKWFLGPGEEYNTNPPYGKPASGFWVREKKEILPYNPETGEGYICFMGHPALPNSFNYSWVCEEDYQELFRKLRVDQTDPSVLLISGIIFGDGTIELGKMYTLAEGIADDIIPGDYSIRVFDLNGQVLANIPFCLVFENFIDSTGNEKAAAAFGFTICYPETALKIIIQHEGEILKEIIPNKSLLHDAVDSIPDYGFIGNADQRRKALHNKINEFEEKIENNEIKDARNKLENDIKDKFEKWLVDGYQKENPGQLSKDEVISLVDNILKRFDIIWNLSADGGEIAEPESDKTESDIGDADPETDSLNSELLAFWVDLEDDAHLDSDSPSTDADDDSTAPEDGEEDIEEDPPTTDNGEADTSDDEAIAVEEAAAFTLFEAAETINELDPENFSNEEVAITLTNEIDIVLSMIDEGLHAEAKYTLQNDILERTNGCANIGEPDENDWIRSYEGQGLVYPLIVEAIELLESLI